MVAHDQAGGVQHCNEALFLSHIITDRSLETINLISCTNHSNPFSSSTFQSPLSTCLASISESFFPTAVVPTKESHSEVRGALDVIQCRPPGLIRMDL